ncbi:NAD(P)-dependent alcohol dehydrogenase [Pricia sp.]|uniref:NAD(P)-dependent alcohol dehydrogenase n=1 Tax=Pricia sp. TaxID=2268138 RepID=UPI003592F5E1
MKAIVCEKYGPPSTLQIKEVTQPVPKEKEVLVKVHAAAINDYDWSMVRGRPHLYRLFFGVTKPKRPIPGMELAGTIQAVGANATLFEIGDPVYGDISEYGFGSFAEYLCINENALCLKPTSMSFEEAAAIPHASMLAYQGLIDVGQLQKGQKVLINGAGGGVGTFGLQIAKMYDAEVTGVDTGAKLKRMKALGFDHVIDYKKEDFVKNSTRYDLILDAKTTRPIWAYQRVLQPAGKYVTVGGTIPRLLQLFLLKPFISMAGKKKMHLVSLKANKDLTYINQLYEEGKIQPVIDGPYALEEIPWAIQYFGEGKHTGKVVIKV